VAGETTRRFASGAELWRLGAGVAVPDAIERLKTAAGVEYAEPNYLLHATATPDDLFFPQQWSLVNTGQDGGTAGADIDATGSVNLGGVQVSVDGGKQLGAAIANRPEVLACYARNWLRYLYGRADTNDDLRTLTRLRQRLAVRDYGVRDLLIDVTQSAAFLHLAPLEAQ